MVLWGLFVLCMVVQCVYALYFFLRILFVQAGKPLSIRDRKPVSIIICARNEAVNLRKNLPLVLAQHYHNGAGKALYEVIVVNDASDDDTMQLLKELEQQYDNLWDVVIAKDAVRDLQGKKFALSKGLAFASHEWLLLTDADCAPASDRWLEQMAAPLADGKEIVAGYGGYRAGNGLLNAFVRWETMHTFLQYGTYAQAGQPYMAVGRNMACTKAKLLAAQGSTTWNMLPSGDDDLLVSIMGTADNMAVVCAATAFTYSDAKTRVQDWVGQKQRHLSTGKYYKPHIKGLLGGYAISHAGVWLCFLALLLYGYSPLVLAIMGARCLLYWFLWALTAIKLHEKKLVYLFPLFDIAWMVYNFAFLPYITVKNKKQWT